jgi:hypothetical protein
VLRKEPYGWYVEDKANSDSYFFRTQAGTRLGVYERCEVCPFDGNAVVFKSTVVPSNGPPVTQNLNAGASLSSAGKADKAQLMNLTVALDQYFQHAILEHGIAKEKVISAIKEASNMAEYSAMLGINCTNVVSICALSGLNAMRDLFELPAFTFDQELYARLCAKSTRAVVPTQANVQSQPKDLEPEVSSASEEAKPALP